MATSIRYHHSLSIALFIIFSSAFQYALDSMLTHDEGFSIDIIQQDSQRSPYFNKTETRPIERICNASVRSNILQLRHHQRARGDDHNNNGDEPFTRIYEHDGKYLMNISIGTPPFRFIGVVDTGSNLIWTQCQPCYQCSKQVAPMFDPRRSSTYQDVSCFSRECSWLGDIRCDPVQGRICQYHMEYAEGSYTKGSFAREIVTLDSSSGCQTPSFNHVLFGCGHKNRFMTSDRIYSGIIGLAAGPMSLVSQLEQVAKGRFSYCLLPSDTKPKKSSKLNFGMKASVSGPGTVCTPLVLRRALYYLTLKSITIYNNIINFKDQLLLPSNDQLGNIAIDTGATISYLNEGFYYRLESAVARRIKSIRVPSPIKAPIRLCYRVKMITEISAPFLIFHFENNADVKLDPANTFIQVSKDVWCFAFAPAGGPIAQIYGAFQQKNFLIGYDIPQKVLCFRPVDCSNF